MCVIGITGKYCSGKSTVAAVLAARGYTEIDADALAHTALETRRNEVRREFGTVERRALGDIVFSSTAARERLEGILHPEVNRMVRKLVAERSGPVSINAVFLDRGGLNQLCDVVLWVSAPPWLRLLRGRRRDGVSLGRAMRVIAAQRSLRRHRPGTGEPEVVAVRSGRGLSAMERQVGRIVARTWQREE